uniref:Uncharacterized protein n=1 Tax=Rangifer tarandus platyrhynchus TaxID=3082113 RepID=A0ACB0F9Y1_RANTA|nr:unnamed protein product [Rangifer tarandus platyrhynchus]
MHKIMIAPPFPLHSISLFPLSVPPGAPKVLIAFLQSRPRTGSGVRGAGGPRLRSGGSRLRFPGAAAALRLRTLSWEAGSLGVLICKAAGGAGRGLEAMQIREAGSARGSAPLPRSWGQRCQAQLDERRQLGE